MRESEVKGEDRPFKKPVAKNNVSVSESEKKTIRRKTPEQAAIKDGDAVQGSAGAAAPRTDSGRSSLCNRRDTAAKQGDGGGKEEGAAGAGSA